MYANRTLRATRKIRQEGSRETDFIDDTQINSTPKAMGTCEITIKKNYSIKNTGAVSP